MSTKATIIVFAFLMLFSIVGFFFFKKNTLDSFIGKPATTQVYKSPTHEFSFSYPIDFKTLTSSDDEFSAKSPRFQINLEYLVRGSSYQNWLTQIRQKEKAGDLTVFSTIQGFHTILSETRSSASNIFEQNLFISNGPDWIHIAVSANLDNPQNPEPQIFKDVDVLSRSIISSLKFTY